MALKCTWVEHESVVGIKVSGRVVVPEITVDDARRDVWTASEGQPCRKEVGLESSSLQAEGLAPFLQDQAYASSAQVAPVARFGDGRVWIDT